MVPLERFDAILFDLNGTLAERFDRFGPDEDYYATYRSLGGRTLAAGELRRLIDDTLGKLIPRYRSGPPDPFPALRDCMPDAKAYAESELRLVEETVAAHECGRVSSRRAVLLHALRQRHRLGLVSDLWAPASAVRRHLETAGLVPLFGTLVFSCEHGAVKPAPRLFEHALEVLGADAGKTLFVGDDAMRDVAGASACGMKTVWIGDPAAASPADWVLRDVLELAG